MDLKKVVIVCNPKSGSFKQSTLNEITGCLASRGVAVEVKPTTAEPGSATKLAAQAAQEGADLVIAQGGDGTACQVAEGLTGTDTAMAVFPGGTGNLLARSFYSEPKPEAFVKMLLSGVPQPIDMVQLSYDDLKGQAHSRLFMVALGLGKVSDAISEASPFFKKILGKFFYVIRVTLACLVPNARRFTINARGDEKTEEAAAVFVLNTVPPAMGMLSRGCNASDGMLDVAVFQCTNTWQIIKVVSCLAFGRPEESSHYHRLRTSELTIASDKPVKPNIDGDPGEATRAVRMKVLPGAVKMIISH